MKVRKILLPTVAMLALIGCSNDRQIKKDQMVRNTYKSLEDCEKDYKREFCERKDEKTSEWDDDGNDASYNTTYFHGPYYPFWIYQQHFIVGGYQRPIGIYTGSSFYPTSAFAASGSGRAATVSVTRGGFGSIGSGVAS